MRGEVCAKVVNTIKKVTGNVKVEYSEATERKAVKEWDSLRHIRIIIAIEKEFKIKFQTKDITSIKSVGDIVSAVVEKCSSMAS